MFVLRYALDAAARSGRLTGPVPVWCPAEPADVAGYMTYKEALKARPIEAGRTELIAGLAVIFHPARHPVETYHAVFTPAKAPALGSMLFYTADTEWYDELPEVVGNCRVLIAEASLTTKQAALAPTTGHLTAAQAARLGVMTGAEYIVLTH